MQIGYLPGVFDLFHIGHKNIIDKAIQYCDCLIIGIHTDAFVTEYKRCPIQNQNKRLEKIREVYGLNKIQYEIVGSSHKEIIAKYGVTHIFHGSDWELDSYKRQIRYYEDNLNVEIMILPYTDSISTTSILKLLNEYRNVTSLFFDLDKTLLFNGRPTHGAVNCIQYIQSKPELKYNVITNNNKYTPLEIVKLLQNADIHIPIELIRTPLIQIRDYLTENKFTKIFVWGTQSAKEYLRNQCSYLETTSNEAEIIVVMYNDKFTYTELSEMLTSIQTKPYIISNIDVTYPDKQFVLPDTGIIQHVIQTTVGKLPERVFGKPNEGICCIDDDKNKFLMIGDSLITDGKLAENLGIHFFHVTNVQDLSVLNTILHTIHN